MIFGLHFLILKNYIFIIYLYFFVFSAPRSHFVFHMLKQFYMSPDLIFTRICLKHCTQ